MPPPAARGRVEASGGSIGEWGGGGVESALDERHTPEPAPNPFVRFEMRGRIMIFMAAFALAAIVAVAATLWTVFVVVRSDVPQPIQGRGPVTGPIVREIETLVKNKKAGSVPVSLPKGLRLLAISPYAKVSEAARARLQISGSLARLLDSWAMAREAVTFVLVDANENELEVAHLNVSWYLSPDVDVLNGDGAIAVEEAGVGAWGFLHFRPERTAR